MIEQIFNLDWKTQVAGIVAIVVIAIIFKEIIVLYIKRKFSLEDMISFGTYVNKTIHFKKKVPELLEEFLNEKK